MKNLLWEIKYELKRVAKHMFYLLLICAPFICWYAVFGLFTGVWDIREWSNDVCSLYVAFSFPTGFGYIIYRMMT